MTEAPDALTHLTHFSPLGACTRGKQLHRENASGCVSASDDDGDIEAEERLAIQTEQALAVRQTIDGAQMLAGLLQAARWLP
jgi:hypothetical protein